MAETTFSSQRILTRRTFCSSRSSWSRIKSSALHFKIFGSYSPELRLVFILWQGGDKFANNLVSSACRHFYFVGLTGQYDESVCLWSFTFHWPSLRFVDPKSNLRHKVPDSKAANFEPKLPADAQEKLEGWIEPELRLYVLSLPCSLVHETTCFIKQLFA